MPQDPREVIEQLCSERKEDFRTLSRLLGRNKSYIQQFVRRGVPKRLGEEERRKLARYFGVSEKLFGGPTYDQTSPAGLVGVPLHADPNPPEDAAAAFAAKPYFAFDDDWIEALLPDRSSKLAVVRVEGDALAPTLNAGDDVLIDLADGQDRLRDGIYALRTRGPIILRRVAINPFEQTVAVRADNPAYPDWTACRLADIDPVGRAIWFGRRLP